MPIPGVTSRRLRLALLALLLATLVAGPIYFLRDAAAGRGRSTVCAALLRLPATRQAVRADLHFSPSSRAPFLVVPPDAYYTFNNYAGGLVNAGSAGNGLIRWGSGRNHVPSGQPARGAGLIFAPEEQGQVIIIDERSRGFLAPLAAPHPIRHVLFADRAAGRGDVLFAAGDRSVSAFDARAAGAPGARAIWTSDVGGVIASAPVRGPLFAGPVYCAVEPLPEPGAPAAGARGAVDALAPGDGRVLWRAALPHAPSGRPAADARAVYCASAVKGNPSAGATVTALDAADGRAKWNCDAIADAAARPPAFTALPVTTTPRGRATPGPRTPAIVGPDLVCVSAGNAVYGVDAVDGHVRWRWAGPTHSVKPGRLGYNAPDTSAPAVGPPLVRDGVAFVATRGGARALDARTGRELWAVDQIDVYQHRITPDLDAPPVLAGNLLFVAFRGGNFDALLLPGAPAAPSALPPTATPIRPLPLTAAAVAAFLALVLAVAFRRLKATVALASLALGAATAFLWADSYARSTFLGARGLLAAAPPPPVWPVRVARIGGGYGAETAHGLFSADGSLTLGTRRVVWETSIPRPVLGDASHTCWFTRAPLRPPLKTGVCLEEPPDGLGLTTFAWTNIARPSGTALGEQAETTLTIPHWVAVALFAVPPLAWLSGAWRDRRRYPKGHCPACGYDCRATPERCPECGQAGVGRG